MVIPLFTFRLETLRGRFAVKKKPIRCIFLFTIYPDVIEIYFPQLAVIKILFNHLELFVLSIYSINWRVVVFRSLEDLDNFAGAEDWLDVAAGVIGFAPTGLGRKIANACLLDLMKNFRGNLWGNNGPGVITRTLQRLCGVEHVSSCAYIYV